MWPTETPRPTPRPTDTPSDTRCAPPTPRQTLVSAPPPPPRHSPDTRQTLARHSPDTPQTLARHSPDTGLLDGVGGGHSGRGAAWAEGPGGRGAGGGLVGRGGGGWVRCEGPGGLWRAGAFPGHQVGFGILYDYCTHNSLLGPRKRKKTKTVVVNLKSLSARASVGGCLWGKLIIRTLTSIPERRILCCSPEAQTPKPKAFVFQNS